MARKYQPDEFERKWVEKWDSDKTYKAKEGGKKQFVLAMFPYPSGAGLHVGHVRNYTGTDVVARYYRMSGYSVLHPMGWDAFGLPAENAAIKAKKNPMDMVPEHIATFKRQMKSLGFSYDWDREFTTTDPEYYKWTQWLFQKFYKMGLLYKKDTPINYCPSCKTGLAEEEVLPNGTHERCGNKITKKDLPQWIFKITSYGDRLLEDLKGLDWPEGILAMQRNWIGRKEGINITYKIKDSEETVTCFTTRPDTNFGATFVVLAPEHGFVKKIIEGKLKSDKTDVVEIKKYVGISLSKSEIERQEEGTKKTGVFTGFYAINNLNGREMPIWVSDFVLSNFGTGAVVGVPGHDLRDYDFATTFGIDVLRVVVSKNGDKSPITKREQVQEEEGTMVNSEFLDGMNIHDATKKVMDYMEEKKYGKRIVSYHLRDWIFSRQRYWGEPIPMVQCVKCGWQPVPESELPLKLPYLKSYEPGPAGESPLSTVEDWVNTKCPKCGGLAKRETDTMPNWAGSCWYFLRFADPKNGNEAWSFDAMKKWQPVDWYLGGAEHAVLHLLYSRFWVKALYDMKLLDFKEPFMKLRNQGMILAEDHRKMSKSYGNVINPDDVVKEYGADALRIYEMFMAPFNTEIPWSTKALQGSYRFVKRVWDLFHTAVFGEKSDSNLVAKLQKTVRKITSDIPEVKFNTSIAAMMEFLNDWEKNPKGLSSEDAQKFLKVLAPFAPFMSEEIWSEIFKQTVSIHVSDWPKMEAEIAAAEVVIPVQVMGKLRATIKVRSGQVKDQRAVEQLAVSEEKVKKYIEGKEYRVIYVPGKILNIIVK
ncbi:MAG: leucine--tRNA ligase [Patescibacteria group bacterium]